MNKDLIEKMAKAMAKHSGWDNWDTATDFCHTPSGNDPEDEREYWRDLATLAYKMVRNDDFGSIA